MRLPGWTNDISILANEYTVLISTLQKGMIFLIDIRGRRKPFIVSQYQFQNQNGMYTCVTKSESYLFINNNIQLRGLPLRSHVVFHSEIMEITG